MPELPEVENVKLSLHAMGFVGQEFTQIQLLRQGLRVPFPPALERKLRGQTVVGVARRAKYLLFETENYFLISHLGMTGKWRRDEVIELQKHDHVVLHFKSGFNLVFNDARRFGVLDLVPRAALGQSRWFKHLGIEPLTPDFDAAYLFKLTRKFKGAIKGFIMDQKRVVGVGNIYASEALFAAGVRPTRPAGRLTRVEAAKLVGHIHRILRAAIAAGGSTIRDYRNSQGEDGSFQKQFLVYDRKGQPCLTCAGPIRARVIAGRNTFWCVKCQR